MLITWLCILSLPASSPVPFRHKNRCVNFCDELKSYLKLGFVVCLSLIKILCCWCNFNLTTIMFVRQHNMLITGAFHRFAAYTNFVPTQFSRCNKIVFKTWVCCFSLFYQEFYINSGWKGIILSRKDKWLCEGLTNVAIDQLPRIASVSQTWL